MPLSDTLRHEIEKHLDAFCLKRSPKHVQHLVKLAYVIEDNSVILCEDRPWFKDDSKWLSHPIAQFKFIVKSGKWRLFCLDQHSKWHIYRLLADSDDFKRLLDEVDKDPTHIFWG
ncbi:MAG: DUF3024 domain-containing protein [Kiritimatiellae bacterium]|nr:DUF3024 domain-containing protein [Kiritimatiellia bacterium]